MSPLHEPASPVVATIVIPAWNLGDAVTPAIESALAQGARARTLLVDNASDTPLPTLGEERLVLDRRVSVALARNAGLERVETPYVLFLDADDRLLPGTVDYLADLMQSDPRLVAACCTPLPWDPVANRPAHRPPFPPEIAYRLCGHRRLYGFGNLVRNLLPVTGCTLIRAADARAAGGFADSNFGEDWVLGSMLPFRGRVVIDRRAGSRYSMRPGSLSTRGSWSDIVATRREIRQRVRSDPAVPRTVRALLPLVATLQYGSAVRRFRYRRPPLTTDLAAAPGPDH